MITFYYLNRAAVDSHYSQATDFVQESYEKWVSKSTDLKGRLAAGSFLRFIGIDLGEAEASGGVKREHRTKFTHTFPAEHKLPIVWRYLQQRGELAILTPHGHADLVSGKMLLFEGKFLVSDRSGETAMLSGKLSGKRVSLIFSTEHMPTSVLASLMYKAEGVLLSGCGLIMSSKESEILIRPVAFGLNFLKALEDE